MTRQLLDRWTGKVRWAGEAETKGDAVRRALAAGASLHDCNLHGCDLRGANLHGCDLSGCDLHCSDLRGANLSGANLHGSDLSGCNLRGANLTPIRDDLWAVLSAAPAEVPALIAALRAGRVDGSAYSGACACLIGTIANARHCDPHALRGLVPNAARPAERWFLAIAPGDTPATSPFAALAVEWAEDWLTRMRLAFATGGAGASVRPLIGQPLTEID